LHGRVEEIFYSTADLDIPDDAAPGNAPQKQCPNCLSWIHAALPQCECGYIFPICEKRIIVPEGEMLQLNTESEKTQQIYYQKCLEAAFERGCSPKWASDRFRNKYNFFPPIDWRRNSHPPKGKEIAYRDWILASGDRSLSWVARQLELEGILE
jgi:hypothetical protein